MGLDANAHFSEAVAGAVGSAGLEKKQNTPAQYLIDFATQWGLWIPSTYENVHYGPHGTWYNPHLERWHRCDYLVLSGGFYDDHIQTWVEGNLDVGGSTFDHVPVAIQLGVRWQAKQHSAKTKTRHIDLLALKAATSQAVENALQRSMDIPWELDVHEHGAHFVAQIREDLEEAFPTQRKGPYRDFITKDTWDIRGQRRTIRRRLYQRTQTTNRTDLCAAFQAWKTDQPLSGYLRSGHGWYLRALLRNIHDRQQLRKTDAVLKQRLRQDREHYCQQVAEQAATLPPSLVLQKMRCIGVMGKSKRREAKPLQTVLAQDGTMLTDEAAINARWQQHFEQLEDGVACNKDELLEQCVEAQRARARVVPQWYHIPSLLDIEESFRLNKTGRASFFDGLPTDLCHLFPQTMAKVYYALALKQTLHIAEPLTLKGGVLIHAYKGRGLATECSSYRSLMVSSVLSKSLHRVLRSKCMKHFQPVGMPLQLGGLPGKSVSQGAHALLSFAAACRRQNLSLGVLFIDIRQAFYRLVRQHIVNDGGLDEATVRLFRTLDLPHTAFQEFAAELHGETAMDAADVPEFLKQHVAESLNSTWFRLKDSTAISLTRKGSRPGDNMADLLFTFAFRKIMMRILDRVEAEGISMSFQGCGETHPFPSQLEVQYHTKFQTLGPVWADDLAILVETQEATELLPKLRVIAATVIDTLAIYGMEVNCDRGKSELVLDIRGKGSHEVKRELYRHSQPCLDVMTRHSGRIFLHIVAKYKHLGTVFAAKGSMTPEIRQRLGQSRAEFQKFRKRIYANKSLPVRTRVELFKSLVLSGLSFNVAVWPALKKQEHHNYASGLNGLYGSLAAAIWGQEVYEWREEHVTAKLQVPDATTLIVISRLRYLHHLVTKADEYVWAYIHHDGEWLGLIAHDLLWLQRQCARATPTVDPRDDWQPWSVLVRERGVWRSLLKRAERHCMLQNQKRVEWYGWHKQILLLLKEHEMWKDSQVAVNDTMHGCLRCGVRFATKAAWSVHCFKLHGRVTRVRSVAQGETCVICHKIYATHDRLINHLRYSQKCFKEMRRRHLYTNPQPARNSVEELRQRHVTLRPTMPVEGPMIEEPQGEVARHLEESERELIGELVANFHNYEDDWREAGRLWQVEELVQCTWTTFQNSTAYPAEMKLMLSYAISHYNLTLDMADPHDATIHHGLEELYNTVNSRWGREWIMGHLPTERTTRKTGQGELDPDKEFKALQMVSFQPVVPKPLKTRMRIFLHLFSGHRREGDVQECVEAYSQSVGGTIAALSVDLVVSEKWGDLMDPKKKELFVDAILQGWVTGVVSGPPCETWSKARERSLEEAQGGTHGPRPLRSVLEPWGLEQLTVRELVQLVTGNALLGISVLMFTVAWLSGTFALLEHPMEPGSTVSASIWRLEILKFLAGLPQVQKLVVYQGFFGAVSPKPTTLLVAHGPPHAGDIFRQFQTRRLCPTNTLIGRDETGKFRTSALKAYPHALCKAIAAIWYSSIRGRMVRDAEEELPDAMKEAVANLQGSRIGESTMGPDFHSGHVQIDQHGRRPAF